MIHTDRLGYPRVNFGPAADDIEVDREDRFRAIRDNLLSRGCSPEFAASCAKYEVEIETT